MATRQRPRTPTMRPPRPSFYQQYEDFQPMTAWQGEGRVHTLSIHLPGFLKEQIKVFVEPLPVSFPTISIPARLTVGGERPLGNNTWSRFNQTFSLPESCDLSGIKANFEYGILTIKIPQKLLLPERAKATQERKKIVQRPASGVKKEKDKPPVLPMEHREKEDQKSTSDAVRQEENKLPVPMKPHKKEKLSIPMKPHGQEEIVREPSLGTAKKGEKLPIPMKAQEKEKSVQKPASGVVKPEDKLPMQMKEKEKIVQKRASAIKRKEYKLPILPMKERENVDQGSTSGVRKQKDKLPLPVKPQEKEKIVQKPASSVRRETDKLPIPPMKPQEKEKLVQKSPSGIQGQEENKLAAAMKLQEKEKTVQKSTFSLGKEETEKPATSEPKLDEVDQRKPERIVGEKENEKIRREENWKILEPKHTEKVVAEKGLAKVNENGERGKESVIAPDQKKDNVNAEAGDDQGKLKKGFKDRKTEDVKTLGISKVNEDRQLLVNMGAAAMVITGLGVYTCTRFILFLMDRN